VVDLAWTLLTLLLVVVSLVVLAVGFPGAIARRAKTRLLRRPATVRDERTPPRDLPGARKRL
jgi:hypothetical protein